jgi:hypothetical protein
MSPIGAVWTVVKIFIRAYKPTQSSRLRRKLKRASFHRELTSTAGYWRAPGEHPPRPEPHMRHYWRGRSRQNVFPPHVRQRRQWRDEAAESADACAGVGQSPVTTAALHQAASALGPCKCASVPSSPAQLVESAGGVTLLGAPHLEENGIPPRAARLDAVAASLHFASAAALATPSSASLSRRAPAPRRRQRRRSSAGS